jgi:hypothetical protein
MKEWIAILLWSITKKRSIAVKMLGEKRVKEIEESQGLFS